MSILSKRLVLPIIKKSKEYNLKAEANYIFSQDKKDNWKLIKDYAQITEWKDMLGKPNYKDTPGAKGFMNGKSHSAKELRKYRFDNFKKLPYTYEGNSNKRRNESLVKFNGNIEELNNILANHSIKTLDGFVTGSNSSGGLKKPDADPLLAVMTEDVVINYKGSKYKYLKNEEINITSIFSNIYKRSNVRKMVPTFEDVTLKWVLDNVNLKVSPYGTKSNEDVARPIREALIEQNVKHWKNKGFSTLNFGMGLQPESEQLSIIEMLKMGKNPKIVKEDARVIWSRNVESNISKNKYSKDFLKDVSRYDRAHIVDNAKTIDKIVDLINGGEINKAEDICEKLVNEENYLLLTKDIHDLLDDGHIAISNDGYIHPTDKMEDIEEFDKILSGARKEISKYLTPSRIDLLKLRNHFR